jgi:hypothetical protein
MTETHAGAALPVVPTEFDLDLPSDLPFYYGSLSHLGIDYLVEPSEALKLLLKTNGRYLEPALFDGKACVSCNYQLYLGQFSRGANVMQVIEFNIVAYPAADADRAPMLTYRQYATGEDQTGSYGFCRIHVACDSDLWVKAGQEAFGEPKFKTAFDITIPAVNRHPGPPPHWTDTWSITCKEEGPQGSPIVTIQADLTGLPAHPASIAPFIEYGHQKDGKPLAAPLNIFQPYQSYDLTTNSGRDRATITPGPAAGPVDDFIRLIDGTDPAGAWVYQSPPVAVHNRPYFVNVRETVR